MGELKSIIKLVFRDIFIMVIIATLITILWTMGRKIFTETVNVSGLESIIIGIISVIIFNLTIKRKFAIKE